MRSRRGKWGWRVEAVVLLVGGLLMASSGPGVMSAAAAPPSSNPGVPPSQILSKLDQIQAAITGGGEGNDTLRWDQVLPAAERFVILPAFNSDAVLDKETGLVWEKSPATTAGTSSSARSTCANKAVGGRKGWRLPSMPELASLVDPSVAPPGPTLPQGHPFLNIQPSNYWSAPAHVENPTLTWGVGFGNGSVLGVSKSFDNRVWCVRGGMSTAQY